MNLLSISIAKTRAQEWLTRERGRRARFCFPGLKQSAKSPAFAAATSLLLSACASHVQAPEGLSNVAGDSSKSQGATAANAGPGEKFDAATDEIISKETLKAWRHAIAHDDPTGMPEAAYKELRQRDEAESMDMLNKLAERFSTSSYIKVMMGQVKQHFGKKEEAAALYEEASLQNRRDPILIFKAAEMRRKSGNNDRALGYYKQVLKLDPEFPGAKAGMARCLMQNKESREEGQKIIDELLAKDPEDKYAKEALADASPAKAGEKGKEKKSAK